MKEIRVKITNQAKNTRKIIIYTRCFPFSAHFENNKRFQRSACHDRWSVSVI